MPEQRLGRYQSRTVEVVHVTEELSQLARKFRGLNVRGTPTGYRIMRVFLRNTFEITKSVLQLLGTFCMNGSSALSAKAVMGLTSRKE